jgi:hypothetical protein
MSSSTDVVTALDVALRVAAVLESLGCEYFVGGSLASSLQGEPRATNDIVRGWSRAHPGVWDGGGNVDVARMRGPPGYSSFRPSFLAFLSSVMMRPAVFAAASSKSSWSSTS